MQPLKGVAKIDRSRDDVRDVLQTSLFTIDFDPRALPWAGISERLSAFSGPPGYTR
jgi:hypothetical protein